MTKTQTTKDLVTVPVGSTVTYTSADGSWTQEWTKINSEILPGTFAWAMLDGFKGFGAEMSSSFLAGRLTKLDGSHKIKSSYGYRSVDDAHDMGQR